MDMARHLLNRSEAIDTQAMMSTQDLGGVHTPKTRKGTTVDEVVEQMADAIVAGHMRPGERLDEIRLAARFMVSRTPIREALAQLATMGLVERRPNRGAVVAELSPEHIANLIEAMAELEAVCARLATERMSVAERQAMEANHLRAAGFVRLAQSEAYGVHDSQFHAFIHQAARNAPLQEMAGMARSRLTPFRSDLFAHPARLAQSFEEHESIVTAMLQGDGARAEHLMRAHIRNSSSATLPHAARI